ncbi:hypothetical protein AWB88_02670 [Mycobacterium paraense]|nr:hypothetical protein AWB88_02670 [Mycobacterium paraense]
MWCDTNRIPIDRVIIDEGISASRYGRKTRDGWVQLKEIMRPGHIVVSWEASRATRDVAEWARVRDLCADRKVLFAYNGRVLDLTSGDDRFVGGLDILLAERESELLRERFMRGQRGAALKGTAPAALGWGYRPVPRKPGEEPKWELDPVEAPRIREAVQRIINGESLLAVGRWLEATGFAPANHTSLRRGLTRPTIAGKRVYRGEVIGDAVWPAIISEEDQAKVVEALKYDRTNPGPEPVHLCSGIAVCAACGGVMRHKHHKAQADVYRCTKGCGGRKADMLDAAVEKAVLRRLRNINPNDYASDNPEIAAAEKRIRELEADLAAWREKAINEEVSAEMFASIEKDRTRKIAELRPRTVAPQRQLLTASTWDQGTIREKRETVRALLVIRVLQVKHLGRRATEDDVDITLR